MRGRRALLLPVLALTGAGPLAAETACATDRVDLRWPGGAGQFVVEVADDSAERAQGLMFRESLATDGGMLFVYAEARHVRFWMKNTLIPLDMIFADAVGRVTHVHENAIPRDETPIDGGADVQYVLEINGGLARQLGIAPGAELRHPAIGAGAAWPCNG